MFTVQRSGLITALVFTLILFPFNAFSDQGNAASSSCARLLVLGDSLSAAYGLKAEQGWVSLLQTRWRSEQLPIDLVNAAISGDTSDGGLARLPRLLEQHKPTHVLIELGGNDGLQGHPVTKLKSNLESMIALVRDSGAVPLLQDMQIPTNYGKRYTAMFTDSYEEVAEGYDVTLIPFFMEEIALNDELMQRDGIHPNAEAQPQIANFMYQTLTPLILDSAVMQGEQDCNFAQISYNTITVN